VITAAQTDVALTLEAAAMLVEAEPGLNVLDALQRTAAPIKPRAARDQVVGDTYYALLAYLPPHVEAIGAWSDAETSDRVAHKLRQLARTIRKGGPAHVDGALPPLADPSDVALTVRAEAASRGRKATRNFTPEGKLRLQRATAQRWLGVQQRKAHPDPHKLTELELRIAAIDRELAELEGDGEEEDGERELVAAGNGHRDERYVEDRYPPGTFPLERRPTTVSGL